MATPWPQRVEDKELPWIPRIADEHKFDQVVNEMLDYNNIKHDKTLEIENKMMNHRKHCIKIKNSKRENR